MKEKFNLPVRKYCDGEKKMVSLRLPKRLWEELECIAAQYGWTTTDVVTTCLDEFAQWEERKQPRGKRRAE